MDSGLAGILGALIGGGASFAATWYQQRCHLGELRRANKDIVRTIVVKGAFSLLPNTHRALGMLREVDDFETHRDAPTAERVGTSVSVLVDPFPSLPTDVREISDADARLLGALASASTSVTDARAYLSAEGLNRWAAPSECKTNRRLSGFVTELAKSHTRVLELLQSDGRFRVLSDLWSDESLQAVENSMYVSGWYIKDIGDMLRRMRGASSRKESCDEQTQDHPTT